jgi:hypothetical protein
MKPAPLVPCSGKDFVERLPEAQCTIGDRQFRSDREPTGLQVDQQLAPALGALANADLEADQLLFGFCQLSGRVAHRTSV